MVLGTLIVPTGPRRNQAGNLEHHLNFILKRAFPEIVTSPNVLRASLLEINSKISLLYNS
jgi:hypothetical protein